MRIVYLVIIFCFWSFGVWATNYCNQAIGCWPMTEGIGSTTGDRSGNNNSASFTSVGNPSWSTTVPSFAISGSAVNSLLYATTNNVTASTQSNMHNIPAFTLVAWVYPTSDGDSNLGRIFDKSGGGNGWSLNFAGVGSHNLSFSVQYTTTALSVITSTALTLNAWNFVVVTWDGSTTATNVHIYKNNSEVSYTTRQNASGTRKDDTAQGLYLGNVAGANRTFIGRLTEMAIFDRVLDSSDRTAIYNYGLGYVNNNIINDAVINNATIR